MAIHPVLLCLADPNWGNFLYDAPNDLLYLIDFGAARHYSRRAHRAAAAPVALSRTGWLLPPAMLRPYLQEREKRRCCLLMAPPYPGLTLPHCTPSKLQGVCGRVPADGQGLRGAGQGGRAPALHLAGLPHRWGVEGGRKMHGSCAPVLCLDERQGMILPRCGVQGDGMPDDMPQTWRPLGGGTCAGDESRVMLDAHVEAGFHVGVPFGTEGIYDFGEHGKLTKVGAREHGERGRVRRS